MNQEKKPIVKIRRVIKHGCSHYICLPCEFIRRHNIKPGDRLAVLAGQIVKIIVVDEE